MTRVSPFAGMSDGQVIERAATHLQNAARFLSGSQRRVIETAKFWAAYDEFGRREDTRVLRRLAVDGRLTTSAVPGPKQPAGRD